MARFQDLSDAAALLRGFISSISCGDSGRIVLTTAPIRQPKIDTDPISWIIPAAAPGVETTEIEAFLPVMKEIDFGDRFLLSMLHWCGIGRRSTPLAYWKVFLLRSAGQVVGVSGLYRQTGTPEMVCWVGGLAFALAFDDKALAHARCIYCGTSPEVSSVKSYGFTLVRRMISRYVFTKA